MKGDRNAVPRRSTREPLTYYLEVNIFPIMTQKVVSDGIFFLRWHIFNFLRHNPSQSHFWLLWELYIHFALPISNLIHAIEDALRGKGDEARRAT